MKKGYEEGDRKTKIGDALMGGVGSVIIGLSWIFLSVMTRNSTITTIIIIISLAVIALGAFFSLIFQRYYFALGVAVVFIGIPIIAVGLVIGSCFFYPFLK